LKRFVDLIAAYPAADYEKTFVKVLYPGLRHGLRSRLELIGIEILGALANAITTCSSVSALTQLRPLLAYGDDEANFFLNIHHIQVHRRTRALRRLADFAGSIRSTTLSDVFVPLVGHFVEAVATTDHLLVNEAITTISRMAAHLAWGSYNSAIQHYLKLAREWVPTTSEKATIRTVVSILDNFHFKMGESLDPPEAGVEPDDAMETDLKIAAQEAKKLARIEEAVTTRLLPSLLQYLERRDEAEEAIRIPVAIGIARVAMHLPDTYRGPQISKLVVVLSQILRSKSQEVRDLTRETLCKIAVIIGPESLFLVIKELRGYSLAVHNCTSLQHAANFTALDACVGDVAHISAEVVFGQSGKDTQSEEFKTKMREVRSSASKGLDSFMITAKHIIALRIAALLTPIRAIMHETVAIKPMQQAEDVLRRVASGLNANANLKPVDILVLCHTLISRNTKFLKQAPTKKSNKKRKTDFDVEPSRNTAPDTDFYAANSFRFIVFGLELFVTGFRRGKFDFGDPEIIGRLEPMVVVIGNTLYSFDGHVVMLGLKATASIVKYLTFLLEVITPDIEEPERQAAVFSLLRATIALKFIVPEMYDLMAKVSEMLVTNQSTRVQELSRSMLLQFLLDYPQGKGRLRTQLTNLARNLDYVFDSGRKSVMELLSAVFSKFTDAIVDEYAEMFFVALVLRIARRNGGHTYTTTSASGRRVSSKVVYGAHPQMGRTRGEKEQLAEVAAQGKSTRSFRIYSLQSASTTDWEAVYFPHAWVRLAACRLVGFLFASTPVSAATLTLGSDLCEAIRSNPAGSPLKLSTLVDVAQKLCLQSRGTHQDETLSTQVVKNLFYIGKTFEFVYEVVGLGEGKRGSDADDEEIGPDGELDEGDESGTTKALANPFAWLFSKLSYRARSAHIVRLNRASHSVCTFRDIFVLVSTMLT
ncbi:U3 snoRNP protein, partial [Ceratobasidium sp. 414]